MPKNCADYREADEGAQDPALAQPVLEKFPRRAARNVIEIVLDPRSIRWLLGFGGALTVVGLIILLWVNHYLTPPVIAVSFGITNAAVLAGGWATTRYSRYQTAGRALCLLACLVMPLNLWYYHSHGLITIDGHLWVAALVISALYAASALRLRDERFAYIFMAGIVMTGLLILADLPPSPQKFWEIASPSTLLVVLGLLALHAERIFPEQEGPFSRSQFGMAFFRSGQVLLAAGLLLVLGAQICSDWLYQPFFKPLYGQWHAERTPIVTESWGQILALCLVMAGVYACLYSDIIVRRIGVYLYLATSGLVWAAILTLELLHLDLKAETYTVVFALVGVVLLIAHRIVQRPADNRLAAAAFQSANTLLSLSLIALVFIGLSRLASGQMEWGFVAISATMTILSLLAAALMRDVRWRRWYFAMVVAEGVLTILAVQALSTLTMYQKLEIFGVASGLALLVIGHVGWYREEEMRSDLVSVALFFGSLLAGMPLAVATLYDRWHDQFILLNEVGFLVASITLLATGFILRIKSTTLTGGALTALYFVMLLVYVPWSRLNTIAIAITAGGTILFSTGLLLSVYRDRLREMPDRIKRREGVFRVLGWR
jgi:hypothetical protein